jgi:hypothetical protein
MWHETHDRMAVAAAADRLAGLPDRLATCVACVALLGDLRRITLAMPSAALPMRNRDFRLAAADAIRLRRAQHGLRWRRRGSIGAWKRMQLRLVGGGLIVAGAAGLLLTTVPSPGPGTDDRGGVAIQAAPGHESTEMASGDTLLLDESLALPIISGGLVVSGIGVLAVSALLRHGSLR